MTDRRIITMLIALCTATFFVTSAGASMAPFLNLITRDLATTLPAVAHLFSIQALAWGVASLVAAMVSDRFGRRAILVGGIFLIGMMRLGFSISDTYAAAVGWQILSGIGGGAFMGIVYAVVSEHATPGIRGRAMSWVITGQSLSLVLGVPLVTLLGALGGWRGAIADATRSTAASPCCTREDPLRRDLQTKTDRAARSRNDRAHVLRRDRHLPAGLSAARL